VSGLVIGLAAGALTTSAWLPQLRRTWRARRADTLSWAYLGVFGLGVGLWVVYGVLKDDLAVLVTNVVTFTLVLTLVTRKLALARAVGEDRSGERRDPGPES
jgi:MtN3 and saliva related transmembrane protein